MRNSNYYEDNQDLQAIFEHFLDRESTVQNYEEGFRDYAEYQMTNNENLAMAPSTVDEAWEYYSELINTYGELAGKEMAQIAAECDHHGLKFEDGKVTHPGPQSESSMFFTMLVCRLPVFPALWRVRNIAYHKITITRSGLPGRYQPIDCHGQRKPGPQSLK